MPQPLVHFNTLPDAPTLHIAIANGFPPETYIPMLRPFFDAYQVVSLPPRALWHDGPPPEAWKDWRQLKEDLLAAIKQHNLQDVIAVGHSFGGIASMLAVIEQPERFKALIMLDPTILLEHIFDAVREAIRQGETILHPMVTGALRRRREFESVDEAYEYFKGKPLFQNWPDETIRLYARHGLQAADNGTGMTLAWSPEWEAYYFNTMYVDSWQDIPKLRNTVPVLVVRGGSSDTFVGDAENRMRELLPEAAYEVVPGHGHLFPQSAPEETGKIIRNWLERTL